MNTDTIIKRYRFADEEEQLNLFLSYPELRNQFVHLDLIASKAAENAVADKPSGLHRWALCRRFCRTR